MAAALVSLVGACSADTTAPTESLVSSTPSVQSSTSNAAPTSTAILDNLQRVATEFVSQTDGGVAALTIRDGRTTTVAAGVRAANGDPIEPDTPFRVGSISKPFIATMVLQLVDEGQVDLEAPLSRYLPDAIIGADVKVRSLLSHRSGIPNYTDQAGFFLTVLADRNRTYSSGEILEFVADETTAPAGEQFSYSNTNYILLGQLIEAVGGMDLAAALRTRIAEPLSLEATTFPGAANDLPVNLAAGWSPGVLTGDSAASYESIASSAWSAGALISTTRDLARFLTGLFDGELISAERLDEMTDVADDGYGLGLFSARLGPDSRAYAHNGSIPGYSSTMAIDPVSGDVLVILTNNDALIADQLAPLIVANW